MRPAGGALAQLPFKCLTSLTRIPAQRDVPVQDSLSRIPQSVAIGDVDGANGADLVVTHQDQRPWVMLTTRAMGRLARRPHAVGDDPPFVAFCDLDGVNGSDLAVANPESDERPQDVAIGDLDGVNGPDLALRGAEHCVHR